MANYARALRPEEGARIYVPEDCRIQQGAKDTEAPGGLTIIVVPGVFAGVAVELPP
jgi:hypothetical protein